MNKLIDTLNNLIKLVSNIATLVVLGGLVYGGFWGYHKITEVGEVVKEKAEEVGDAVKGTATDVSDKVKNFDARDLAPKVEFPSLFGGTNERIETTSWGEDFARIAKKHGIEPPPPPSKDGCEHRPPCSSKEQHILANLSGGKISGEWVGK